MLIQQDTQQNLIQYFTDLPADRINQDNGVYEDAGQPCCVGAHLAYLLRAQWGSTFCHEFYYLAGADALAHPARGHPGPSDSHAAAMRGWP